MRAALLVTGDEVLGGRVGERNAGFLARSLAAHGVRVQRTVIVGDSVSDVAQALLELLATGVDLICTTGGLGPTADDLTMVAVAAATGRPLALSDEALALVTERSRLRAAQARGRRGHARPAPAQAGDAAGRRHRAPADRHRTRMRPDPR